MTTGALTLSARMAVIVALGLVGAGAATTFLVFNRDRSADVAVPGTTTGGEMPGAEGRDRQASAESPARLSLTPASAARAGIRVGAVLAWDEAVDIRAPGIVEANGYQKVVVTPLVAGRVTDVLVQLGEVVARGRTLARVHSPEFAEAFASYRSVRAMLGAHDLELARTERLAAIGAASRQELERLQAEHASILADLDSARERLALFGVDAASLNRPEGATPTSLIDVPAPLDGVILERRANLGTSVEPDTPLFTVANLSTVWIIAELYERDFGRVPLGARARIRTPAYPELSAEGRVSYIDPQVAADTRTAKVRIEIPNPGQRLRLGMFVDVVFASGGSPARGSADRALAVPRSAVQTVGDQSFVYVVSATDAQSFEERAVRLGRMADASVEVLSGLSATERVVVEGSFAVRAEIDRLGLRQPGPPSASATPPAADAVPVERVTVRVTKAGFEPSTVTLAAAGPLRLAFVRTTDETCATEVVFPTLGIRRPLPLNTPVEVDLPARTGTVSFVCGMDMLRGTVVVR